MAIRSEKRPVDARQDGLAAFYVGDLKAALENGLQDWLDNVLALTTEVDGGYWPWDGTEDVESIFATGFWGLDWVCVAEEQGWDNAVVAPLADAEEAIAQFCAQQTCGNKIALDWLQGVAVSATLIAIDSYRTFLLRQSEAPNPAAPYPAASKLKLSWERGKAMDIAERWGRVAARWCRALVLSRERGGRE